MNDVVGDTATARTALATVRTALAVLPEPTRGRTAGDTRGSDTVDGPAAARDGTADRWGSRALALVFVVGFGLQLAVAVLPEPMLWRIVDDGALYYVGIAEDLLAGNGSTFDGITATNGYHPLWLTLVTPLVAVFGEGSDVIRAMAVMQAAVSAAAFLVIARLLRSRLGPWPAAIGLCAWWVTPQTVLTAQSGMETSLAALGVALVVVAAMRHVEAPGPGTAVALGGAAALAFLARTDAAVAVIAVALWILVEARRTSGRPAVAWRLVGIAAAVGSAAVLPWVGWNLARFGSVTQASTTARPLVLWDLVAREGTESRASTAVSEAVRYLGQTWPRTLGWSPLLALAGGLVAYGLARRGVFDGGVARRFVLLGGGLVAAGTVLGAFHAGARLLARDYYFGWTRTALALLVAGVVAGALELRRDAPGDPGPSVADRRTRPTTTVACAFVFALLLVTGTARTASALGTDGVGWQPNMAAAGQWLERHAEPGDRVLSFNAGYISAYTDLTVVNLSGVINDEAFVALRARELGAYMCDAGAEWYVDLHPAMVEEHRPFLGAEADRLVLEPVTRIRIDGSTGFGESEMTIMRLSCDPA